MEKSKKQPLKFSFDVWWALASKKGNFRPHLKEIMWADFRARGLNKEETLECFYDALKQFGYTV